MNIWMFSLLLSQGLPPNTPGDLDPLNAAVLLDDKAYLLRAPEFVADQVERFAWKGDQLIYVQSTSKGKVATLWNGGKATTLGEFPANASLGIHVNVAKGAPLALFAQEATKATVVLVGQKLWTQTFPVDGFNVASSSEAILVGHKGRGFAWLPDGTQVEAPAGFDKPGSGSVMRSADKIAVFAAKKWAIGGTPLVEDETKPKLRVEVSDAKSGPDNRPTWRTEAWLISDGTEDPNRALIHPDVDAFLSNGWEFVAVNQKGSLFIRRVHTMSLDAFFTVASAAESREIMSRAKQVGTAMMIFAADNADKFPGREGWKEALMPYTKNADLMAGFEYTLDRKYTGANDLENPSETELGRVRGRYGQAIVRGDSSVIWVRRKP